MAATFYDLKTEKAYRIYKKYNKHAGSDEDLLGFFNKLTDQDLFTVKEVDIELKPWDLPGRPLVVETCENCREEILDGRHLEVDGCILCKACNKEKYYGEI